MFDLSGKWHSIYQYHSGSGGRLFTYEHEIIFKPHEQGFIGKSVREHDGSEVIIELQADERVFTGTWQEHTAPKGHYHGKIFHGAIQLLLSEDGHELVGKWVGFNSGKNHVKAGDWRFRRL